MNAIEIRDVSKRFRVYHDKSVTLKERLLFFNRTRYEEHQVLKGISFNVEKGTTLGLIGQNGSGKSTLLKLLSGIIYPDSGDINIHGRVSSLLELGAGFHPDFSGRENIYNNASIFGLTKGEIDKRFSRIVEFSGLQEFIDNPVRTYSSGMYMRLAFSVAINVDADILLIDEILAVGDTNFQKKCFEKILGLKKQGKTIIIVTHDLETVLKICDYAIWLENGIISKEGLPVKVVDSYFLYTVGKEKGRLADIKDDLYIVDEKEKDNISVEQSKSQDKDVFSNYIKLISFGVTNEENEKIEYVISDTKVRVFYKILVLADISEPHYGIRIRDSFGLNLFESNTYCMKIRTEPVKRGQAVEVIFEFLCNFSPGSYYVSIGMANKGSGRGNFEEVVFPIQDVGTIDIIENENSIIFGGIFNLNPKIEINMLDEHL